MQLRYSIEVIIIIIIITMFINRMNMAKRWIISMYNDVQVIQHHLTKADMAKAHPRTRLMSMV